MVWAPTPRLEVVTDAVPLPSSVPVPMVVAPSAKVTVPVGVPLPGAVTATVAVKVTGAPSTDGEPDVVTAVVVAAGDTVWVAVPDDTAKELSPA